MTKANWAATAVLGLALALVGQAHAAIVVGDTPPDSLGRSHQGGDVRISALHGKVVVVTFWASWCGYCRKELPVLAGLQDAAGKERLQVVAVNYQDDHDVYRELARKLKDVQLTLTHDASGRIGGAYGVKVLPYLLIIGKDGKVAFQDTGYGEESLQVIVDAVNKELAKPSGS
ncbi:MAG: TlpA family protein disulfide reductase [Luteimonas sp.]